MNISIMGYKILLYLIQICTLLQLGVCLRSALYFTLLYIFYFR